MVAVSVLIRTIGRQAALKDALESLRAQVFRDFETVIVEDGPATLEAFLSGYKDINIGYEALGLRMGRSAAGNRALLLARGEYCIFLDEDDAFYPDHLQNLWKAARDAQSPIAFSWSHERKVVRAADGSITRVGRRIRTRRERFSPLALTAYNYLPINAVLFHRALVKQAGGFDEDIDCLEDWLLWLRFMAITPNWACAPNITALYHVPFDTDARREAFRIWQPKIRERMRSIHVAWGMDILHNDMHSYFSPFVFLRKLYYHLTGYL